MDRTLVIGDIHGDLVHLERLLAKLPALDAGDTVVFLGDYIDRGPQSREVVARVQKLCTELPGRCVTLRGNHEDAWLRSLEDPNPGFLLPANNGCLQTMLSLTDCSNLDDYEKAVHLLQPQSWFPSELREWMQRLPTYYEDVHAIYVHAGLEGEGTTWLHPSLGHSRNLMWCREPDFYRNYHGKRLIFGHTQTSELPMDHLSLFHKLFGKHTEVWMRGDLIGIDTGCGKNGFLSAIELPSGTVYESRS
jgi:serine/threonine protein phosphatase 1